MSKLLDKNENWLEIASQYLREGNLVAFPTETVYGLGANALSSSAVKKIYLMKRRPFSDPVIAHVSRLDMALPLLELSPEELRVFHCLAAAFWPGPLTVIAKASSRVPPVVTANTGFIGVRMPDHPTALALIEAAGFPVAAPSANLFGHVSPTKASHVEKDFAFDDVLIIQDDPSEVGIESTIVKIESENRCVVLRRGKILPSEIQSTLDSAGFKVEVITIDKYLTTEVQEAPGQLIKHYSPEIPAFLLSEEQPVESFSHMDLNLCVAIDFHQSLAHSKQKFAAYYDLSPSGNFQEAAHCLFDILRKAEMITEAKAILLYNFYKKDNEASLALFDRIYRAAAGQKACFKKEIDQVFF